MVELCAGGVDDPLPSVSAALAGHRPAARRIHIFPTPTGSTCEKKARRHRAEGVVPPLSPVPTSLLLLLRYSFSKS